MRTSTKKFQDIDIDIRHPEGMITLTLEVFYTKCGNKTGNFVTKAQYWDHPYSSERIYCPSMKAESPKELVDKCLALLDERVRIVNNLKFDSYIERDIPELPSLYRLVCNEHQPVRYAVEYVAEHKGKIFGAHDINGNHPGELDKSKQWFINLKQISVQDVQTLEAKYFALQGKFLQKIRKDYDELIDQFKTVHRQAIEGRVTIEQEPTTGNTIDSIINRYKADHSS